MHIALLVIGIVLIGALVFYRPGRRPAPAPVRDLPDTRGPLSEKERRAVEAALAAKGKQPWIMREKGLGVVQQKG